MKDVIFPLFTVQAHRLHCEQRVMLNGQRAVIL
jgi:hypothetical protein